ncbi:S8 family serine peptidase [Devosia sp. ZB163]|uniref:S8 family peptidase n=1 Tax=Devosia sp. ZB163 TaxID=3025938 RepID=UPI00235DE7D6|nr:S8 family serine peptidase [Devosia sp. ZB163]MDC9825834.1 S8 family serine peptidase [Devosia sp. ZB163]
MLITVTAVEACQRVVAVRDAPSSFGGYPFLLQQDSAHWVELDATRALLCFLRPVDKGQLAERLGRFGLELERDRAEDRGDTEFEVVNHTDRRFWVREALGAPLDAGLYEELDAAFDGELEWVGAVYRDPEIAGRQSLHCPVPDVLIVDEVVSGLEGEGLRADDEGSSYLNGYRRYSIEEPRTRPAARVAQEQLRQRAGNADAVLYENMPLLVPLSMDPVDTFYPAGPQPNLPAYPGQWNLRRIRAYGPGRTAHDVVATGSGFDVIIAVIDSGCDLTHPDIAYVAGSGGISGNGSNTGVPGFAAGHGTMVAGIAGATSHNLKGVASVAGYWSRIMPLAFSSFTNTEAARLINFAVANGARVINMSWNTTGWPSTLVTDRALNDANGVVLCAAAGNGGGVITYPATHPNVIACGAVNNNDRRANFSNFGTPLSVVAPGVDVPTTTTRGSGTLSDLDRKDWVHDFTGTSAAAPHVAGLAAMLIAIEPTLTPAEIRAIIEGTSNRVPPSPYNGQSENGPWNTFVGNGRIDAMDAVSALKPARLRR